MAEMRRPHAAPDGEMAPVPDVTPDLPGLHWRATLRLLTRLPQGAMSRGFGRLADVHLPPRLRRPVLRAFARATGIDASEAELPLDAYPTINRFFVRRLRPGLRAWPDADDVAGSPVDGTVGQSGAIRSGTLVQAKGRRYSAADLLSDEREAARRRQLGERRYVAVHAENPVRHDEPRGIGRRLREFRTQRRRVAVAVSDESRSARQAGIEQRRVVEAILVYGIAAAHERRRHGKVGHVAGRERSARVRCCRQRVEPTRPPICSPTRTRPHATTAAPS